MTRQRWEDFKRFGVTSYQTEIIKHVEYLESQLAQCYKLSGADPDGNEDWRLAPRAVEEVRRLREDVDLTQVFEVSE